MTWRQWIRLVEIVPALGSAEPDALESQVDMLLRTGCRVFHLRVGEDLEALETARLLRPLLRRYDGVLEVAIDGPGGEDAFAAVADAGGASVTFQLESVRDVAASIDEARASGLQAGVAFGPETEPAEAARAAAGADLVRCPGDELDDQVRNVRLAARSLPDSATIMVGGGVTHENVRELYDAGARVMVVGSAIFHREDLPRAYRRLVQALA